MAIINKRNAIVGFLTLKIARKIARKRAQKLTAKLPSRKR